jgi:polyisoprenoid-binding protein YceI
MTMLRPSVLGALLVLLSALPLSAEKLTFELDPGKTSVQFTFGATLHTVNGSLRAESGTVQVDTETGRANGWIVLDATSAQTGNSRRDFKMHEKILESRRYPDMVFQVERISGALQRTGRSEVQLHGGLEMHGTRRPIALPATVLVEGDQVRATAYLTVPYLEWGLSDPSFFILRVAKEVRVVVQAAGHLAR